MVLNDMIGGVKIILWMYVTDAHEGVAVTRNAVQFIKLEGDMSPTCLLMEKAGDF